MVSNWIKNDKLPDTREVLEGTGIREKFRYGGGIVNESQHMGNEVTSLPPEMSSQNGYDDEEVDMSLSFEEIVSAIDRSLCERLDLLEARVDELDKVSDGLEQKVDNLHDAFRTLLTEFKSSNEIHAATDGCAGSEIAVEEHPLMGTSYEIDATINEFGSKDDYPDGSWLGDINDPRRRVRCSISPMELFHIESTCLTAEKMAVKLMDNLFDRETLAMSSIAGGGRYNKKRLDPLKIYAIQFHLRHRFSINSDDWQRIKNNMDSKCRTAFRRKSQGLPLGGFHSQHSEADDTAEGNRADELLNETKASTTEDETPGFDHDNRGSVYLDPEDLLTMTLTGAQSIQTSHGPIQVLNATSEQIAELERTHQIRILREEASAVEDDITETVDEQRDDSSPLSVSSLQLENSRRQ